MDPDRRLCAHLAEGSVDALPVVAADAVESWDGPATACVPCPRCGAGVHLELVAWRAGDRVRVYALRGIALPDVGLYRRNVSRGSCDLARLEAETAALHGSAGPVERIVALDLETGRVLASVPTPEGWSAPAGGFAERGEEPGERGWFRRLGVPPVEGPA